MSESIQTPSTPNTTQQTSEAPIENLEAADTSIDESEETSSEEGSDEVSELEAKVASSKTSKAEKKAIEKKLKKIKLKVDGEEFEEEFDPEDDNYLRDQLQLAKMARKRAQEKNDIEKDVLEFLRMLREDPVSALSDPNIGFDVKSFAKQVLEKEIADSKKSPLELELEKERAELKRLKEENKKKEQDSKQKELERLTQLELDKYNNQISIALDKNKIPNNPAVVKRIGDYMLIAAQAKKALEIEDIIPLIRDEMRTDLQSLIDSLAEDDFEDYIGKNNLDRYRKKKISKTKTSAALKAPTKVVDTGKSDKNQIVEEEKKIPFKDFFRLR